MSDKKGTLTEWKTPDELIRLHRLKQKQKALQARLDGPTTHTKPQSQSLLTHAKRKNPFLQVQNEHLSKKQKSNIEEDFSTEDSIFKLLSYQKEPSISTPTATTSSEQTFPNISQFSIEQDDLDDDDQIPSIYLPVDWSLKTKLRILSNTVIMGNCLKACQEASGITSFVRCLNATTSSTGLDISPGARIHQSTMYWQHPNLPWLTLFPRNAKSNNQFVLGEPERAALSSDWVDSFRALFQLLRARQCPYFYVCANSFTVLFRSAGIGGRVETHAFLTPTSRGMRAALRQEDIEFTMPLKNSYENNKSMDSVDAQGAAFSILSNETIQENVNKTTTNDGSIGSDDDEDQEKWLASLGVEAAEIKKISSVHAKNIRNVECEEDFSNQSIIFVEGVECQAFFNFLLNAKSTTANVGKLAGVPPTLLAPVAFPGATLKSLKIRSSKIRMDDIDYQSMELRGIVMPHILQYLCSLMKETKDIFSATMISHPSTISFNKAAQKLIEDINKENSQVTSDHVFGRENLSDCGLPPPILESLCRVSNDAVRNLERICYNKENGGYTWFPM